MELKKEDSKDGEDLLTAPEVCRRQNISTVTLWRRERDENLKYPPCMKIGRNRFWRLRDLRAWENSFIRQVGSTHG